MGNLLERSVHPSVLRSTIFDFDAYSTTMGFSSCGQAPRPARFAGQGRLVHWGCGALVDKGWQLAFGGRSGADGITGAVMGISTN